MEACRKTIQQFLDRNLEQWNGLAPGCDESALQTWLAFNSGEGITHRGIERVTYRFRSLSAPGFQGGVFFYFEGNQLSFIGTEYWSFDQDECAEVRQQLGEPAHLLDFHWKNMKFAGGELVYSDKGISLGIIPETQLIASVLVFPACAMDVYEARYYNTSPTREFKSYEVNAGE